MKEKILFDFTYYQQKGLFHGGGEYGNMVLKELLAKETQGFGIFFYENRYVDMEFIDDAAKKGWNLHPIRDLRNIVSVVKQFGYTTIYSAIPYDPMWSKLNLPPQVRFIGTFHGLRSIETALYDESEHRFFDGKEGRCPDFLYTIEGEKRKKAVQEYGKALLAFRNKKIITVSQHSKYSMHYYFPQLDLSDIIVLYSPQKEAVLVNDPEYETAFLNRVGVSDRNFGLLVSAGIYLKNALRGILAYDNIFENHYAEIPEDYKVVVLGVKDKDILQQRIKHKERFILLGYAEENELETLYKHAQLFVYPTLNEGFGYPPLEAMKYGTLCACSGNTSIPEICGDMVLTFNPFLIDEIIVRVLQSFSVEIQDEKKRIMKEKFPKVLKKQQDDLKKLIEILMGDEEHG